MLTDEMKIVIREFVQEVVEEKKVEEESKTIYLTFENKNIQSLCVNVEGIDANHMKITVSPRTDADKEGNILVAPNTSIELAKIT